MTASREPFIEADTAALLTAMAADFAGAPAEPTVEQRRQGLNIAADIYGPDHVEVESVEQHVASGPNGPVALRVYRPVAGAKRKAVVAHIHGGGWVLGDPDGYERICRAYCAAGDCIIVDIDYRRAPEHKHPVALQDCLAALDWIRDNIERLGGGADRIVVTGDSAGGHLAAGVCQQTSVPVALQILVYPVMSASRHADFPSRKALGDGRYFLREFDILRAETEYFSGDDDRECAPASPLLASAEVLARQPRTVVITAGLDPLRDEGRAYVDILRHAGASAREHRVPGTIHGFVLFSGRISVGRAVIEMIGREIRSIGA